MSTGVASLTRFAWLSIAAAAATIALKVTAYLLTGSVGLLSDAIESSVNLAAAVIALLIFIAASAVIYTAVDRLLHPRALEQVGIGLAVSGGAAVLNFFVARVLLRAGEEHRSITLTADGKHLMTDVWTSVGVIVGVGLVALLHWPPLDPIVAILVGVNILFTGWALIRNSSGGLMDAALPAPDLSALEAVLDRYRGSCDVGFREVRTRAAGQQRFVSLHILVPGGWTVREGHALADRIETDLQQALPGAHVTAQIVPLEDAPASPELVSK